MYKYGRSVVGDKCDNIHAANLCCFRTTEIQELAAPAEVNICPAAISKYDENDLFGLETVTETGSGLPVVTTNYSQPFDYFSDVKSFNIPRTRTHKSTEANRWLRVCKAHVSFDGEVQGFVRKRRNGANSLI